MKYIICTEIKMFVSSQVDRQQAEDSSAPGGAFQNRQDWRETGLWRERIGRTPSLHGADQGCATIRAGCRAPPHQGARQWKKFTEIFKTGLASSCYGKRIKLAELQCVPRKGFRSVDNEPWDRKIVYIVSHTADPNPFLGTHCLFPQIPEYK